MADKQDVAELIREGQEEGRKPLQQSKWPAPASSRRSWPPPVARCRGCLAWQAVDRLVGHAQIPTGNGVCGRDGSLRTAFGQCVLWISDHRCGACAGDVLSGRCLSCGGDGRCQKHNSRGERCTRPAGHEEACQHEGSNR